MGIFNKFRFLYLWQENKILKKYDSHNNMPVLCLKSSKISRILIKWIAIFASGGMDCVVNLWELKTE
jgi:hypothetical protein